MLSFYIRIDYSFGKKFSCLGVHIILIFRMQNLCKDLLERANIEKQEKVICNFSDPKF